MDCNATRRVNGRERSGGPRGEDPRRALGRLGEDVAAAHLERLGFTILERNVRTRHGEIDLIASDGPALVFVEVKTARRWSLAREGQATEPLAWLGAAQRARLRRLAAAWLRNRDGPRERSATIRFDAVGVTVDRHGTLVRLDHAEAAW